MFRHVGVTKAGSLSGAESVADIGNVNEAEGPGFGAKAGTTK